MKDWELDRIYIWIRAASINDNQNGVKFLIDQNDKLLFNLIEHNGNWSCVLNQEIAVRYTKTDIKILEQKIEHLKTNHNNILEFPKLSETEITNIKKVKSEFNENRKNKTDYDGMEFNKIIYEKPAEFGIEWIKNHEIKIEELKRIGF
ncbi:hypothetical protein QWY81_18170 [Polaribacter undariae]|uniref:Uncharacterized protein n=1 Tax=Polaribacter sejongensis TaxID=985043 RepID=A0AAJ1R023_9FLAO|nr:hypothetical protein [Polaribacter undariae]MDN3621396.1 hypothetical protein [Polaribacter undariae]UWD31830.1 hypothetical protein NQP51_17075 [Polaribacter undariae]